MAEIMSDRRWIKVQDIQDLNKKPAKIRKVRPVLSKRKLSIKNTQYMVTEEEPFNLSEEVNKTLGFMSVAEIN